VTSTCLSRRFEEVVARSRPGPLFRVVTLLARCADRLERDQPHRTLAATTPLSILKLFIPEWMHYALKGGTVERLRRVPATVDTAAADVAPSPSNGVS